MISTATSQDGKWLWLPCYEIVIVWKVLPKVYVKHKTRRCCVKHGGMRSRITRQGGVMQNTNKGSVHKHPCCGSVVPSLWKSAGTLYFARVSMLTWLQLPYRHCEKYTNISTLLQTWEHLAPKQCRQHLSWKEFVLILRLNDFSSWANKLKMRGREKDNRTGCCSQSSCRFWDQSELSNKHTATLHSHKVRV